MYNKLFTKILDSSIWLEPSPTRLVWLTFLAAMDEDGFCQFASVANLAHRARLSLDETKEAVRCLESPDENSSDPDNEGKRIERVSGGWVVLNAPKYREMVSRVVAREKTRQRVARFRSKEKNETACNGNVTHVNGPVTPSEATAHTEAKAEAKPVHGFSDLFGHQDSESPAPAKSKRPISDPVLLRLYALFRRRDTTQLNEKERRAYRNCTITEEQLAQVEEWWNAPHPEWNGRDERRRNLETLLNNWNGEVDKATRWKKPKSTEPQHLDVVQVELNQIFGRPKDAAWTPQELAAYDEIAIDITEETLRRLRNYYSVKNDSSISTWDRPNDLLTCVKRFAQVVDAATMYRPKSAI